MAAGGIFLVIAAAFAWEATSYGMGRLIRMGPGFIPLALAIMLGALAIGVALARSYPEEHESARPAPWRGIALVSFALILFGACGRSLGLVPVVFLATLVTALASRRNSIRAAIVIAAALSGLCFVIFKLGLGVMLPTVGPANASPDKLRELFLAGAIEARIMTGGRISNRKGVNLPGTVLGMSPLTAKDRADLAFGLG